ncbi:MAG TPA: PQQ-binding-like beta-propeller repeat protein [Pirellulales bacterium]|nr:PQQ-binding-like beta-propeller repeat protein [Pirellulales bacterium]
MPDISQIIATIEQSNLVADEVVEELRERLEKSRQPVDLKSAVKWLVQKEHVTSEQGRRLLARAGGAAAAAGKPAPADDDDLKLFEEPPAVPPGAKKPTRRPAPPPAEDDDDLELFPLDDAQQAAQPGRAPSPTQPAKQPAARWAGTPKQDPPPNKRPAAKREPKEAEVFDAGGPDIFGAAAQSPYEAEPSARERRRDQKEKKAAGHERSVWDTPFMLFGGGGLLLVIIAIAFFYFRWSRLSGDVMFKQAEDAWKAGSYTQAIELYDKYLKAYPDHAEAGAARVHRGLARLRQAVEGARDYTKTLATAKEVIQEISPEEKFGEAQGELRSLLPQIAQGLAKQAAEKQDAHLLDETEEALKLIDKYIRKTLRPEQELAEVRASLERTRHTMGRDAALKEAVAGIEKSIAEGAPQRAYDIRKDLLKRYPNLAGNEDLQAAVISLSKAEKAAVVYKAEARPAAPADAQSPVEAEVVMADRQGKNAPGVTGQVVQMLAGGAVFAFEADTGQVLWRRFVGYDTTYVPRPIGVDAESDLLLVDSQRQEVLRVERRSGKLKWRHAVGEPFDAHPVVAREQVWLATRQGKLVTIELETGNSPGYVELPQGLRVGPAFDSRGQTCYQLGENSNLFALSASNFQCQEVLYLGHEPESVHVPPAVVSPYIFVVEDRGAHDSLLHILMADDNGANIRQAQEAMTLTGHVLAPLEASGRTLVAATDRGAIYSFEINPPDPGPPLVKVAERPADDRPPLVRYPLLKDTQLWIAGNGIVKYDVLASRGKLEPRSTKDEGDIFIEQPSLVGGVLFHARRHGNQPDVAVSAVNAADSGRYWETRVAAPPAGAPLGDAKSGGMLLFNRVGALFAISPQEVSQTGVKNAQAAPGDLSDAFTGPVSATSLADGGAAVSSAAVGSRAWVANGTGGQHWVTLPDRLAAPAVAFHGGLLAPGRQGQVTVIDPATGRNLLQPFQPRVGRGAEYRWSTPLVVGDEALLADGESKIYRLAVSDKPEAHLAAIAEAELTGPIIAPLAVAGNTLYAVNGRNELVAFGLGEANTRSLSPGKSWTLAAPVAWGPYSAGSHVLVSTLAGQLLCLNDKQELVWQADVQHGPLSGTPLLAADSVLIPTKTGRLCKLALASGEEQGVVDLGEPLAAGPFALGERLLLAAKGGALFVVARP